MFIRLLYVSNFLFNMTNLFSVAIYQISLEKFFLFFQITLLMIGMMFPNFLVFSFYHQYLWVSPPIIVWKFWSQYSYDIVRMWIIYNDVFTFFNSAKRNISPWHKPKNVFSPDLLWSSFISCYLCSQPFSTYIYFHLTLP